MPDENVEIHDCLHPDAADHRLRPEEASKLGRWICRLFGHAWRSHRFVNSENGDVWPAFSCITCYEMRVFFWDPDDDRRDSDA